MFQAAIGGDRSTIQNAMSWEVETMNNSPRQRMAQADCLLASCRKPRAIIASIWRRVHHGGQPTPSMGRDRSLRG
jgi:hypothetical protein